jgi:hypothetical protein
MKKYILLLVAIALVVFSTQAQIKPSQMSPATVDAFKVKFGLNNPINPNDTFYTKTEVNLLHNTALQDQFQNDCYDISGIDYLFPIGLYSMFGSGGTALTSGTCYYVTFRVKKTMTVSKVTFMQTAPSANYTGDAYNGAVLFSVNKTTGAITELTRTVNDTEFWKNTTSTKATKNFGASQTLVAGSYVALGFLYHTSNQTIAPSIYQGGTINAFTDLFLAGFKIAAYKTSQTDFASTNMSQLTTANTVHSILIHN